MSPSTRNARIATTIWAPTSVTDVALRQRVQGPAASPVSGTEWSPPRKLPLLKLTRA